MTTSAPIPALSSRPAWKALEAHHAKVKALHLRQIFADDPKRGERLTLEAAGLFLDYSKNRVTEETMGLLVRLAEESGLRARIDAMFRGEKINVTENRAVLHVARRVARDLERADIVCLLPDGGWKYLSTQAWAPELERAEKGVAESLWW